MRLQPAQPVRSAADEETDRVTAGASQGKHANKLNQANQNRKRSVSKSPNLDHFVKRNSPNRSRSASQLTPLELRKSRASSASLRRTPIEKSVEVEQVGDTFNL